VMLSDDFARVDTRLPWDQSIAPNRELSYMPLLTHLLEVMHRNGMHEVQLEKKFQYKESEVKPARIGNMCFESHLFRKIRVTYFDGGDSVQVATPLIKQLPSDYCSRSLLFTVRRFLMLSGILTIPMTYPCWVSISYPSERIEF